jgi:hypothetical protein
MDTFKTVLWDDSWHAKSWEGGRDELSGDALCWEYGGYAGMKLQGNSASSSDAASRREEPQLGHRTSSRG